VIDNAMDEALAGHATFIDVELAGDGTLAVTDNGRGIPVDPHPKFPKKSALEVVMCTLHAGGKFDSKVYETSGGLHGVGVSVVNALSERLEVEIALAGQLYRQVFARGIPKSGLEKLGRTPNRRGTKVRFKPDPQMYRDDDPMLRGTVDVADGSFAMSGSTSSGRGPNCEIDVMGQTRTSMAHIHSRRPSVCVLCGRGSVEHPMQKSRARAALLLGFTAAVVLSSSAQAQEPPRASLSPREIS
jgi:Histidine kinase-, DNA gyrase B-, and HSP90-like ATPase